jgi:hypothetical protein
VQGERIDPNLQNGSSVCGLKCPGTVRVLSMSFPGLGNFPHWGKSSCSKCNAVVIMFLVILSIMYLFGCRAVVQGD